MANGLTIKQERLVEAMTDPTVTSQTQAAIKAGYPPKAAYSQASRALSNAKVTAALAIRKATLADKVRGNADLALSHQTSMLLRLDPAQEDPGLVADVTGKVIMSSAKYAETYGQSEKSAGPTTRELLQVKAKVTKAILVGAKLASRYGSSVVERCEAKLEQLEQLIERIPS